MRMVFCSCPIEKAKELAHLVVESRLAACVQILPPMTSVYRWEGKICEDQESLLLLKTNAESVVALITLLKEKHPYSVPEILSVAVESEESNLDYLQWVQDELNCRTVDK